MAWIFEGTMLPDGEDGRFTVDEDGHRTAQRLPGRYGLTGLVDAHAHLTVRPDHTLGGRELARSRLRSYADAGVTLVRDVGGRSEVTLSLARATETGLPAVIAAGRFLAPENRYFPGMHDPVAPDDVADAAASEVDDGARWLKLIGDFPLMVEGAPVLGSLAPTYDLHVVERLVRQAHQAGVRVAVHTQSRHAAALVGAGVDSVEHGEWLDEDAVRALGARGGAWTPTLAAITAPPANASDKRRRYAAEASERLSVLLPRAIESGVRVLAGTDAVGTVAQEVALLVRHGLEPRDALAAASTAAETWLRQDHPSTSLVTFTADPRDDPSVLNEPSAVVVRGRRIR